MTAFEARDYVQQHVKANRNRRVEMGKSAILMFKAYNHDLRRILHDRRTPRAVKVHVYAWLLNRRHRQ
jgi:hypothetical protein